MDMEILSPGVLRARTLYSDALSLSLSLSHCELLTACLSDEGLLSSSSGLPDFGL